MKNEENQSKMKETMRKFGIILCEIWIKSYKKAYPKIYRLIKNIVNGIIKDT